MDQYEAFRRIIDAHPTGAPPSEALDEILHILFTGDGIRIALAMSFLLKTVEEIARNAAVTEEQAGLHLELMAEKGHLFSSDEEGKGIRPHPDSTRLMRKLPAEKIEECIIL